MTSDENGHIVRVSNVDIYRLLTETANKVDRAIQTQEEVIKPAILDHTGRIKSLEKEKADRETLQKSESRLDRLEMRVYALLAGVITALIGAKGLGIF